MTVRIELRQVRSTVEIEGEPVYRVENEVYFADNISRSIFVYETDTQEFSRVAHPHDLANYPIGYDAAIAGDFDWYRLDTVTLDLYSVEQAQTDAAYLKSRVNSLATAYANVVDEFLGTSEDIYESVE